MTLILLHNRLSVTAALFAFIVALWAGWLFIRGRSVDGGYIGAVVIGELLLLVQAALGLLLFVGRGAAPERSIHILYGVMAVLIWPFVYPFARSDVGRRGSLVFAAASLFLWGLVLRAVTTAGGPS